MCFVLSDRYLSSYRDKITMDKAIKLRNIKSALRIDPTKPTNTYQVSGRVHRVRHYKSFCFLDLNDGSTRDHLQVVLSKSILNKPQLGSFIACQGCIKPSKGHQQRVEFKADQLQFVGECDPTLYPLATVDQEISNSFFRKFAHLRSREESFASTLRLRSELEYGLHMIMKQMDFFRVQPPTLTSNDSEASSDLFSVRRTKILARQKSGPEGDKFDELDPTETVQASSRVVRYDYFDKDVFLVSSAQLHLESLAGALSRVYTISPAFRAENSQTSRHLCEFTMFEAEESNLTQLEPLMDRVETVIKFCGQYLSDVSEHRSDFVSLIERNSNSSVVDKLTNSNYIRMDYTEALDILQSKTDFDGNTKYGSDIGARHEKKLLEYCNNTPIFITNFPKRLKPFYMKCDSRQEKALCFDLIAPHGGEICGASLREDSYDRLKLNLEEQSGAAMVDSNAESLVQTRQACVGSEGAEAEAEVAMMKRYLVSEKLLHDLGWYLDLRRFGTFPHGGFGLGIDRLLQSMLGVKNIKDIVAFPRWPGHCPM